MMTLGGEWGESVFIAVSSTYNFDMCVQSKCDTVQQLVESSIPVTWEWQW